MTGWNFLCETNIKHRTGPAQRLARPRVQESISRCSGVTDQSLDRGLLLAAPKMHRANYQNRPQKRNQNVRGVWLRRRRNCGVALTSPELISPELMTVIPALVTLTVILAGLGECG
jgi:hypothetical protein